MASTYENDLRLEEMATGENSGSWGTKTNTNLELIADAFSYGTETIANADTTITIADGAADAARSLALKINSSADLTTTRTITLAPNTTSKVWIIENNTSGGQTLTISAGSGSNVTLANGTTKIIATDGIGAGSNVVELTQDLAIADMSVDGILSLADGSNSAPSLTNTGDTNTGLYFPAADEVGITTGGTQRVKVDSTGVDITGTLVSDGLTVDGSVDVNHNIITQTANAPRIDIIEGDTTDLNTRLWQTVGQFRIYTLSDDTLTTTERVRLNHSTGDITFYDGANASFVYDASAGITINDAGADRDFQVKSDNNANALFVDASANHVSFFGTSNAAMDGVQGVQIGDTSSTSAGLGMATANHSFLLYIDNSNDLLSLYDSTNNVDRMQLLNDGTFVFNQTGEASADFRIEALGSQYAFFVDSGNNVIGTGTSTPATYVGGGGLAIKGTTASDLSLVATSVVSGSNSHQIRYWNEAGASYEIARTRVNVGSGQVNRGEYQFAVNNGAGLRRWLDVDYGGNVVFNADSNDSNFQVSSANNNNMLFVDAGNDRIGIGHNAPKAKLDIMGQGTSASNLSMLIGSDEGATVNPSRTDNTDKAMRMGLPHYNTAQSATALMVASSTSGDNSIFIGGGTSVMNAATQVNIYAADNTTTATGVGRVQVTGSNMVVNDANGDFDFRVASDSSTHALFVEGNDGGGTPSIGLGISDPTKLGTTGTAPVGGGTGAILQLAGDDSQIRMANHVIHSDNSSNTIFHIRNNYGLTNTGAELSLESGHITFNTGSTFSERMRLDPNGNFIVGADAAFTSGGTNTGGNGAIMVARENERCLFLKRAGGNGTVVEFIRGGITTPVGSISVTTSATTYATTSDYRLKTDAQPMTGASARVQALNPVNFEWIPDGTRVDGFLAHEVQSVVPEAVTGTKDEVDAEGNPVYQGIDQSKLVPLLVATIKELEARITALENA